MGTTTNRGLRYPESTVLANTLHTQIKNLADDVDAALRSLTWTNLTLTNGWASAPNADGGAGWAPGVRIELNRVWFRGMIKSGTIGATAFTLSSVFRPSLQVTTFGSTWNGTAWVPARIGVYTDGQVKVPDFSQPSLNQYVSLEGVSFPLGS